MPDIDPDLLAAEQEGAAPSDLAAKVESGAIDPDLAMAEAQDELDASKDSHLQLLFEGSMRRNPDRHAGIIKLAEQSGLSPSLVEANYDRLKAGAAAAEFDPKRFRQASPELAKLLLERPELGPVVMGDDALSALPADLRAFEVKERPEQKGYLQRGVEAVGDFLRAVDQRAVANNKALRALESGDREGAQEALSGMAPLAALRPLKTTTQVTSPRAATEGLERLSIFADAFSYQRQGLERSRIGTRLMKRAALGEDAYDLETQRVEIEQKMGPARYYAATELEKLGLDVAGAAASQVESLATQGAAGAVGKLAGAGVGALFKNAGAGAKVGGFVAKWGGRVAGFANSFDLEAGGAFLEFRGIKGADGTPLPTEAAIGGSLVYGLLAAAVEVNATEATLRAFGPYAKLAASMEKKEIAEALVRDAGFRNMVASAGRDWVKSIKGEAGEEATQDALQKAIGYILKRKAGDTTPVDLPAAVGEIANSATVGALGAAGMGPVSLSINLASQQIARSRMLSAEQQIQAIQNASGKTRLAQASPEALAKVVEAATEGDGAPVTAIYVDPDSITRLFQDTGADLEQAATELMGEDGPKRLARAAHTGQLLEVPVLEWVEKWSKKPIAEALVQQRDVTTRSYWQTPSQIARDDADQEQERSEMVLRFKAETAPESETEAAWLTRLEAQVLEVGAATAEGKKGKAITAEQAADQIAVARAAVRTLSSRAGMSVDQFLDLYGNWVIKAAPEADLSEFAPAAAAVGKQWSSMDEDAKVRQHYQDPNTAAWNERAWEEGLGQEEAAARPLVARISIEGAKHLNDARGHEALDGAYRAAVNGLSERADGGHVFKVGGDLVVRVADRAELDRALASIRKGKWWDSRYQVTGHLGATLEESDQTGKAEKDALRLSKQLAERSDPPVAMAGLQGLDLDTALGMANVHFRRAKGAQEGRAVPEALRQALRKKGDAAAAASTYVHARTGLLTDRAWRSIPRKKFVASIDLRGLKGLNTSFGGPGADSVMDIFGRILAKYGKRFDAAHLHGDEYAMQSDDEAFLQDVLDQIESMCDDVGEFKVSEDGETLTALDGIQFAAKIGGSYDEADNRINRAKARGELKPAKPPSVVQGRDAVAKALADLQGRGNRGLQPSGPVSFGPGSQDVAGVLSRIDQATHGPRGSGSSGHPGGGAAGPGRLTSKATDGTVRGYVDQVVAGEKRAATIFLTPDSDLSTLLHEQGHIFLTILDALSKRPDATRQIRDDLATALAWLGATDVASLTKEQQEAWARGFERYLREGKAPSLELSSSFEAFKRWLLRIYERVADLRVKISPEVRGVFDRLLATDEQIEATRKEAGLQPLFRSPEEAGMSAAEWQVYLANQEDAQSHARKSARLAELREKLADLERSLKATEKTGRAALQFEYDRLPESRAVALLARGDLVDEDGGTLRGGYGRFDRAAFVQLLGEAAVADMEQRHGIKWRGAKSRGPAPLSPSEAADLLGFASPEAFAGGVEGHPSRDAWVETQLQAMLDAEMGTDLAERDRLKEEVEKGLHGDSTASWLAAELKALRERSQPGAKAPRLESIRAAAQEVLDDMELRQLAAAPGRALQAERSSAAKAMKAAMKGNWELAYVHKHAQLLNHYLWRAAKAALEDLGRLQKTAADLSKVAAREKLGRASQVYLDASDTIIEATGLTKQREREEQPASIAEAAAQLAADGISVLFDVDAVGRIVAQQRSWRMLTVPEGRAVLGALQQIRKAGSDRLTAVVDGKNMEVTEVIAHLAEEARQNLPARPAAPSSTAAASLLRSAASTASKLDGDLIRPGLLIDWLGGDNVSSWWNRAIMKPLQEAKHREYDLMQKAVAPVVAAFEHLPSQVRARLNESIDGAKLFPDHRRDIQAPTKRFELLMLALNLGNDSNRQRVLDGRGITEQEANKALSLLTEAELEWVQSVWDACESLWPMTRDLEKRVSGLAPPKIPATPLTVTVLDDNGEAKVVTLRGGYFPAVYDRTAASQTGEMQALDSIAGMLPNFSRPGTPHSHTKARAESFADVIVLDPSVISAHLSQVVHDVAFREALRGVGRLILDPRVQAVLKERLGHERSALFLKWLQDTGSARGSDVASHESAKGFGPFIRKMRSNMAVATLGYAADIALGDVTNLLLPPLATGLKAKHWAAGLAEFMRHPVRIRQEALERSGELRFRRDGLVKEMRQHFDRMTAKTRFARGPMAWWKDNAFVFMEATDMATATPIWWGAYRQGLADQKTAEKDEGLAAQFADKVIRDTFPSHSTVDQSAVLRDRGVAGSLLLFYGYFNVVLNRYRAAVHPIYLAAHNEEGGAAGVAKATAKAAMQTMAISMVTAVMADFLVGRGPEPEDGDDDESRYLAWMQRRLLLGPLSSVPFANPLVDVASGKKPSAREAPGAAVAFEVAKAASKIFDADDEGKAIKAVAAFLKVLAMATGKPGARPIRAAEYLARPDGASEAGDILELLSGLLFGDRGEKQPATPLRPLRD